MNTTTGAPLRPWQRIPYSTAELVRLALEVIRAEPGLSAKGIAARLGVPNRVRFRQALAELRRRGLALNRGYHPTPGTGNQR